MNHWIDRPEILSERLATWKDQAIIGLDTEFIRERTFYPQLALVQLSVPGEVLLVDPLVPGINETLRPLLENQSITKLMHSASEDMQALLRACNAIPSPLFDTQVAAAMAGLGASLGYQKLVEQITGITLSKGETRSDWLKRPLSTSQLDYAADDVLHLHAAHADLTARLSTLGRLSWLAEDAERAVRQAQNDGDDPFPHLSVRSAQSLNAEAQAHLCRLLRWRDAQARRTDRPKSWVIDNELALTLSRKLPEDFYRFNALLDSYPKTPRQSRHELWAMLETPLTDTERDIPINCDSVTIDRQRLKRMQNAVAALAQTLVIPEGLLCARRHLETLLEGRGWPSSLEGWRRELLEPVLMPLLKK